MLELEFNDNDLNILDNEVRKSLEDGYIVYRDNVFN